jgi:uncharacterized protein
MKNTLTEIADRAPVAPPSRLVQLARKRGLSEASFREMLAHLGRRRAGVVAADEMPGLYAETLSESVFGAGEMGVPDCLTCGACCAYFHQIAVLDYDPTPRRLTWAVWDDGDIAGPKTRWLRREPDRGHCVAFAGSVGHDARCAIYELRPHSCRAFEAGSDRCRAVRRAYGLEPSLSAAERTGHAARLQADAGDELRQVEALTERAAASFDEEEKMSRLGEMIEYNGARLAAILREAERLEALLAGKAVLALAENAARHVNAIREEARVITLAAVRL